MTEDIFDGLDSTCKCLENRLNKGFPQLKQTKQKQDIEHTFDLLMMLGGIYRKHLEEPKSGRIRSFMSKKL